MKHLFLMFLAVSSVLFASAQPANQDKSKRPSPLIELSETLSSGVKVTVKYGQPSVKGREIGKDLEPMTGKVWRTGANEATTISFDKNVTINNQELAAGTYSFFTVFNENKEVTLIFNKVPEQWGAYKYEEKEDALRVNTAGGKASSFSEKLVFSADKSKNQIAFTWGDHLVNFVVK